MVNSGLTNRFFNWLTSFYLFIFLNRPSIRILLRLCETILFWNYARNLPNFDFLSNLSQCLSSDFKFSTQKRWTAKSDLNKWNIRTNLFQGWTATILRHILCLKKCHRPGKNEIIQNCHLLTIKGSLFDLLQYLTDVTLLPKS
jgi:hypothetical protein